MPQIVCFDPRSKTAPATIVSDSQAPRLAAQLVALLPVDKSKIFRGAADSFAQRFAGDGWHYANNLSERGLHMFMALTQPGKYLFHWVARIEPIDKDVQIDGRLKLVTDGSTGALSGGLRPEIRIDRIPQELDKHGGVTIVGRSSFNTSVEGIMALCLHGVCNNVKVTSLSISAIG